MPKPFISIEKVRGDKWMFSISFDIFLHMLYFPGKVFKAFFSNLIAWLLTWKFPSTAVTMSIASTGLVAGLLISIIGQVYSRLTSLLAVPTFFENQSIGPKINRLSIENIEYTVTESETYQSFFSIPRKNVAHLQTSARPGEARAVQIMVGYTHPARSLIQRITLGDQISLVGDNNGKYSYTVITTEVRSLQDLSKIQTDSEQLILIVPQTAIQQQFLVVIAR